MICFIFSDLSIHWTCVSFAIEILPWPPVLLFNHHLFMFDFLQFVGFPLNPLFQHDSPGKHCRRRKARTVFSDQQLNGLEKRFEAQRYLSTPERVELAAQLSLSETQVIKKWCHAMCFDVTWPFYIPYFFSTAIPCKLLVIWISISNLY